METNAEYVVRIYEEARRRGLCHKQKEFAELLGMNPSTISQALAGVEKYLTDTGERFRAWERQVLRPAQHHVPQPDARPDVVIPAATVDLYTTMAKTIDRLAALVERLQGGAGNGLVSPPPASVNR